jgi:hypothetical protein
MSQSAIVLYVPRNLVAKGIIDPTKVVRAALQNAASIASSPRKPWSPKGRRRTAGPRLCLAVAWAPWTIKSTPNRYDKGLDLFGSFFLFRQTDFLGGFDVG